MIGMILVSPAQRWLLFSVRERYILSTWSLVESMWGRIRPILILSTWSLVESMWGQTRHWTKQAATYDSWWWNGSSVIKKDELFDQCWYVLNDLPFPERFLRMLTAGTNLKKSSRFLTNRYNPRKLATDHWKLSALSISKIEDCN